MNSKKGKTMTFRVDTDMIRKIRAIKSEYIKSRNREVSNNILLRSLIKLSLNDDKEKIFRYIDEELK